MSLFDDWAKVLRAQAQAFAQDQAEHQQSFREEASQRTQGKSRKPPQITARGAVHWASITLALDSHCGVECIHCVKGMVRDFEKDQIHVCEYCHGFSKRELRQKRPTYTFHGVGPMSIINMSNY